jgi:hypothetical protein
MPPIASIKRRDLFATPRRLLTPVLRQAGISTDEWEKI